MPMRRRDDTERARGAHTRPDQSGRDEGAQARIAAIIMAGTMLVWMAAQWLGGMLAWPSGMALAIDALALMAFVYALHMTWRLWRSRGGR